MARIRTVKPDFFTSDDICALSPCARLLYIGLWCEADKEGRLVWSPKAFKRRYLPEDAINIEAACDELLDRDLVRQYGDGLAYIPTFKEHQHVNPREAASVLPAPDDHAPVTRQARVTDAQVGREGKEGEGRESNSEAKASGGDAATVVRNGATKDGTGLVVNSSRTVLYASAGDDFASAARSMAMSLRDELNAARR